jgi:hypothetical protein
MSLVFFDLLTRARANTVSAAALERVAWVEISIAPF